MPDPASSATPARLLIVEDDPVSRATLAAYMQREGYDVAEVDSGEAMEAHLARRHVDLVLLDITLPGRDGLTLLRETRARSDTLGIILVTAKTDTVDRVVGLELGADDYVTKPYERRELLARVRNVLRRLLVAARADDGRTIYSFDGWMLDTARRCLTAPNGEKVHTTSAEFDLLAVMVANPQRVMGRERLLDCVAQRSWSPSDRSVDVLIARLRRKLGDDPAAPRFLITVRNAGYVFASEVS
ncbi:response regulator [Novispirillum sp. DQ9]|uniref:response regulator n=1 Tax=Novispirillum sp. DQ9 TaxID=3398612 RepID=UPI003C79753D